MLSKKHYIAIAEIIAKNNNKQEIIAELCKYFYNDNIRFDMSRFVKACNKETEE